MQWVPWVKVPLTRTAFENTYHFLISKVSARALSNSSGMLTKSGIDKDQIYQVKAEGGLQKPCSSVINSSLQRLVCHKCWSPSLSLGVSALHIAWGIAKALEFDAD